MHFLKRSDMAMHSFTCKHAISAFTPQSQSINGDGGDGHWLVRMEWRPAGWSVCLPLLIFPCTIKSRSSLLELAHPGDPGKRAVKRLWCGGSHRASLAFGWYSVYRPSEGRRLSRPGLNNDDNDNNKDGSYRRAFFPE